MTQPDLQLFLQKLETLCQQYKIFIFERKEWKERPTAPFFYYDVNLRAKVDDKGEVEFTLMEARK